MENGKEMVSPRDLFSIIEDYVTKSAGLTMLRASESEAHLVQKSDQKKIRVNLADLTDVLLRKDTDGRDFIQVNLQTGTKILLTDHLIGFKPMSVPDLDVSKLPKVVTTMDLMSVFEAIEEAVSGNNDEDAEVLKRVFQAILAGGEDVGFDLAREKIWLKRLPVFTSKTSA